MAKLHYDGELELPPDQDPTPAPVETTPPAAAVAQSAPVSPAPANGAPSLSADQDDDVMEGETPDAAAGEQSDGEADASGTPQTPPEGVSIAGLTREEDVPEALRPMWRSMQAQFTRDRQEAAVARDLAAQVQALGLDPSAFLADVRRIADNPQQFLNAPHEARLGVPPAGFDPQAPPAAPAPAPAPFPMGAPSVPLAPPAGGIDPATGGDPYTAAYVQDPFLQRMEALLDSTAGDVEGVLLEERIEHRKQQIRAHGEQARFNAWQQQQARTAARSTELSRLDADPTLGPLLADPQRKSSLFRLATQSDVPADVLAKGIAFDDAVSRATAAAYKQGQQDGRNNRDRSRGASATPGRPVQTVNVSQQKPVMKRGESARSFMSRALREQGIAMD